MSGDAFDPLEPASNWSKMMASDALDAVRSEMGEVFVNWHDEDVERELLKSRLYLDRARAYVRGLAPNDAADFPSLTEPKVGP